MVVRVGNGKDGGTAHSTQLHILTDLGQTEIAVRAAHVQECAEVSAGLETLGQYSLYDLVDVASIGPAVVGVVVKVEHSAFKARALGAPASPPPPAPRSTAASAVPS